VIHGEIKKRSGDDPQINDLTAGGVEAFGEDLRETGRAETAIPPQGYFSSVVLAEISAHTLSQEFDALWGKVFIHHTSDIVLSENIGIDIHFSLRIRAVWATDPFYFIFSAFLSLYPSNELGF
jgi:hypothetical protein